MGMSQELSIEVVICPMLLTESTLWCEAGRNLAHTSLIWMVTDEPKGKIAGHL